MDILKSMATRLGSAQVVGTLIPTKVSLMEAASGRYPCLTFGREMATFWAVAEVYEKTDMSLTTLSRFPCPYPEVMPKNTNVAPEHLVAWEISQIGLDYIFDVDGSSEQERLAKFLLKEGIAPGQPFRMKLSVHYTPGNGWDTDPETDYDLEILGVEYWEPEQGGLTNEEKDEEGITDSVAGTGSFRTWGGAIFGANEESLRYRASRDSGYPWCGCDQFAG